MSKNVLITNFEIKNFTGSEIHASTIARRFKELGYKVYFAALQYGEPLYSRVKDYIDVPINLMTHDVDFKNVEFDIVWAQHSELLDWLIFGGCNLKAKKIVVNILSTFMEIECVPIYAERLSLILTHTEETKDVLLEEGADAKNMMVFENYSFKSYFERPNVVSELRKIAIVSNHVQEELLTAKASLSKLGYAVDIYGHEWTFKFIDDNVLVEYDLIISIGKTVQYAMSLGIPVYIYDHFGGPGYLNMEIIDRERKFNFDGKGYGKKNGEEIAEEIISGFDTVLPQLSDIKKYAYENFCFERNLYKTLKKLKTYPYVDLDELRHEYRYYRKRALSGRTILRHLWSNLDR